MNNHNSHSILYEKRKVISCIIAIVICIAVTLTFISVIISPTKQISIPLNSFQPTNKAEITLKINGLVPFHSFLDLYIIPSILNITLEPIHVDSSVHFLDNTIFMEKRNDFNVKCTNDICEKILVASITPIREKDFIIKGNIQSKDIIKDIKIIAEYQSYLWVIVMNNIHLVSLILNSIGIIVLLVVWRKTSMKSWYFEHSYLLVLLFFTILYDATYPFIYLYSGVYVLWTLQALESLFIFVLFLYYLITLICMSSKNSINKGSILLGIGVGVGQFCCMISLLMYNGSGNIKNCTKLDQPTEAYVLISALSFTNVLYIILCGYHSYCILRNNHSFKQFIVHLLFSIPVGIILVFTTYNYYYFSLVPPVSFKLATTLSSEILLIGFYALNFGTYSLNNVEYKLVNSEIPIEDNDSNSHSRKSFDLSSRSLVSANLKEPNNFLQSNSVSKSNISKEELQTNFVGNEEIIL
ncbi:hypothetical protein, conserved [Entamoeba histolytica]